MLASDTTLCHDQHELTWAATGHAIVHTREGRLVADARQAVWLPAGTPHRVQASPDALILPLFLPTGSVVDGVAPRSLRRTPQIDAWVRICLQPALRRPQRVDEALACLAAAAADRRDQRRPVLPHDPRARRVADHILARPGDPRGMEAWARTEHMSTRTLQRLFVDETGMTFSRWRAAVRMSHAADELGRGSQIAAVAKKCGYASVAAFTTAFTRCHGIPPGAFRPPGVT